MRDNLFDDSKPSSLTKKFWSYVKCSSKSSSIPEHVFHNNVHATDSTKKANLFNTFSLNNFLLLVNITLKLILLMTIIIIFGLTLIKYAIF